MYFCIQKGGAFLFGVVKTVKNYFHSCNLHVLRNYRHSSFCATLLDLVSFTEALSTACLTEDPSLALSRWNGSVASKSPVRTSEHEIPPLTYLTLWMQLIGSQILLVWLKSRHWLTSKSLKQLISSEILYPWLTSRHWQSIVMCLLVRRDGTGRAASSCQLYKLSPCIGIII
jgi:hypothetical protein